MTMKGCTPTARKMPFKVAQGAMEAWKCAGNGMGALASMPFFIQSSRMSWSGGTFSTLAICSRLSTEIFSFPFSILLMNSLVRPASKPSCACDSSNFVRSLRMFKPIMTNNLLLGLSTVKFHRNKTRYSEIYFTNFNR